MALKMPLLASEASVYGVPIEGPLDIGGVGINNLLSVSQQRKRAPGKATVSTGQDLWRSKVQSPLSLCFS